MTQNDRQLALIKAVNTDDQRAITDYYRYLHGSVLPGITKRYPNSGDDVLIAELNAAFLIVLDNYIKPGKIEVKDDRVEGVTGQGIQGLVYRIASNRLARLHHRQVRYGTVDLDDYLNKLREPPRAEETVAVTETREGTVRKAFAALLPKCKELLRLKLLESLSYQTISEVMGSNPGALRVQKNRCLKYLRKEFTKAKALTH